MPHDPIEEAAKKIDSLYARDAKHYDESGGVNRLMQIASIIRTIPPLAEYAAALRAADKIASRISAIMDDPSSCHELKADGNALLSALAAPHVRALLSGNAGQS